jgi:hypothetical protein
MVAGRHAGLMSIRAFSARWLCLLFALAPSVLSGAGIHPGIEISEHAGSYRIRMVALIRAPAQSVYEVLTDYRHIYRLNPAITQSAILPSPQEGAVRVKTRMEGCIFFFCRDVDRVEEVRELDNGHLRAVIVPEFSDFSAGSADWHIQSLGDDSRILYEAQVTPAFYIPPIIGSYFVKRAFGDAVLTSFERLECVARIRAGMSRPARSYLVDATAGETELQTLHRELLAGEDPTNTGAPPSAGCAGGCAQPGGGC